METFSYKILILFTTITQDLDLLNNNFITKNYHTKLTQSSFTFVGPTLWRKVPLNLKSYGYKTFGKMYKNYLLGSYQHE